MKPRIAVFEFSSCEGCQLMFANLEDEILEVLGAVEIVNFREIMTEKGDDYQIAFVEGAITRESEIERLKKIREQAKVLVALGACAHLGGVNCMKNHQDQGEVRRYVYRERAEWFDTIPARPLSAVVPVDYAVPGCPIDKKELLEVTKSLLLGKKPSLPDYPVCVECKMAENVCVFDKGMTCLGPVTRAGCAAICPTFGNKCEGCRGLVDSPNVNSHKQVLQEHGLSVQGILNSFRMFEGYLEVAK